ncbi:MAG: IPExxxVDY family protein [Bacteroidales bacterium]
MMAKKKVLKLNAEQQEVDGFVLLITSTNKDYRMTFFMNKYAGFNLERRSNLEYFHQHQQQSLSYSVFREYDHYHNTEWYLINNKNPRGALLPKLGKVDFLFIGRGNYQVHDQGDIITKFRSLPNTQFVQQILPEASNHIFDIFELLELMVLEEHKQEKRKNPYQPLVKWR